MHNVTSSRSTPLTSRTSFDQNPDQIGIDPILPFISNQLSHVINTSYWNKEWVEAIVISR